ncbi:MAG: hypothetical protein CRU78_15280 [Candidatus Accumulibacter phosphatis]|uniref:Uncharacterized protein n=1 Tax=Candidatus Accumulibacter phosphatis TaxID=327160 RepID=A0A6A7RWJ3_9PROT|nr:hypothetical protein [Candidatus Accumulibacter phosphatis]
MGGRFAIALARQTAARRSIADYVPQQTDAEGASPYAEPSESAYLQSMSARWLSGATEIALGEAISE